MGLIDATARVKTLKKIRKTHSSQDVETSGNIIEGPTLVE